MRSMVEGATPSAVRGLAPSTAFGGPLPASRVRIGLGSRSNLRHATGLRMPARVGPFRGGGGWQPAPLRRGPRSPVIVGMTRIIVRMMRIIVGVFPHHRRGFAASSSGPDEGG